MQAFKNAWFKLPPRLRQPIILTIGMIFVIASALTGWLPGPGGIPLFLIGITILATEFKWAERLRDKILKYVHIISRWLRLYPALGTTLIVVGFAVGIYVFYSLFLR